MNLRDQTRENKVILTVVVVVIVLLVGLALYGYFTGAWEQLSE